MSSDNNVGKRRLAERPGGSQEITPQPPSPTRRAPALVEPPSPQYADALPPVQGASATARAQYVEAESESARLNDASRGQSLWARKHVLESIRAEYEMRARARSLRDRIAELEGSSRTSAEARQLVTEPADAEAKMREAAEATRAKIAELERRLELQRRRPPSVEDN